MSDLEDTLQQLGPARYHPGLERLICVALADQDFAAALLAAPAQALRTTRHDLRLTPTEYQLVCAITQALDISDFAERLRIQAEQQA